MKRIFTIGIMVLSGCVAAGPTDLQQRIDEAAKNGQKELKLEKGVYRLSKGLRFHQLKDFTFDGGGATLVMTDNVIGVEVAQSRNVVLRNFKLDYDPLPFTQGKIIELDQKQNRFKIKIAEGYPLPPRLERLNVHLFSPENREWKLNAVEFFNTKLQRAEADGEYWIKSGIKLDDYLKTGDLFAMDWRGNYGVKINGTENFRMNDVTIYTAPGLAIIGRFTTGEQIFERVVIGRGPLPPGATEPRLLSAAADGLNYAYCEKGPQVLDCDFSYQGDDSINLHSVTLPVVKIESPTQFLVLRSYPRESFPLVVKSGMRLRVLRNGDFDPVGEGVIQSMTVTRETMEIAEVKKLFHHFRPESDPRHTLYRITVKEPLTIPEGAFIDIPAICGSDFVIRGNYFHDHRGRGTRIMASDGVIENNRFERIKQNAITVGAEYGFWREAGWAENVMIRNNKIKDVGTDTRMTSPDSYAPGAISLIVRPEPGVKNVASGNRNISIIDNEIDGCSGAAIVLHAVDGATVRGNKISNACRGNIDRAGSNYGFKITKAIEVTPSAKNIKISEEK